MIKFIDFYKALILILIGIRSFCSLNIDFWHILPIPPSRYP